MITLYNYYYVLLIQHSLIYIDAQGLEDGLDDLDKAAEISTELNHNNCTATELEVAVNESGQNNNDDAYDKLKNKVRLKS